jgi:hypothetical protein
MRRNSEILLRRVIISVVLLLCFCIARGQEYNRRAVCGSDTQQVRYVRLRTGDLVNFPAFSCKQVSRWGGIESAEAPIPLSRQAYLYLLMKLRLYGDS